MNLMRNYDDRTDSVGADWLWWDCPTGPRSRVKVVQRPKGQDSDWDFIQLMNQAGVERLIFSGDAPYYDYRILQADLESAKVDEASRDRIAYQNAVTLIQRFRPDWELPTEKLSPPQIYTEAELWTAENDRLRLVDAS